MSEDTDPAAVRSALLAVAESCRDEAGRLGVVVPPIDVAIRFVEPGEEYVRTDRRRRVEVAVSSTAQFLPPPEGANLVYGTCHEVGHLVVATVVAPHPAPPVVWDESLAHVLAVDRFLPVVAERHGDGLWPTPYPDYVDREVAATRPDGNEGAFGYGSLLERQTAQLRALIARRDLPTLLAAVADAARTAPRAEDWLWKVRGRALR